MDDINNILLAERLSRVARQTLPFVGYGDNLNKAKAAQEGEVREWQGQKFKKIGGKWKPLTAPRKKAPDEEARKVSGASKEEDTSKQQAEAPQGEQPPIQTKDLGQLRRIKKLLGKKDMAQVSSLVNELPDEAKNAIPPEVWETILDYDAKQEKKSERKDKKEIEAQDKDFQNEDEEADVLAREVPKKNINEELHDKYSEQIQAGLRKKEIKKLTDLVSVQRWSMEERDDYFDLTKEQKQEISAGFSKERRQWRKWAGIK